MLVDPGLSPTTMQIKMPPRSLLAFRSVSVPTQAVIFLGGAWPKANGSTHAVARRRERFTSAWSHGFGPVVKEYLDLPEARPFSIAMELFAQGPLCVLLPIILFAARADVGGTGGFACHRRL
jgi:hypothetical protein